MDMVHLTQEWLCMHIPGLCYAYGFIFYCYSFFCAFHCSNCTISELSYKEERQSLQAFSSG